MLKTLKKMYKILAVLHKTARNEVLFRNLHNIDRGYDL